MTRKVSKATIKFAKFKVVKYGTKTPILSAPQLAKVIIATRNIRFLLSLRKPSLAIASPSESPKSKTLRPRKTPRRFHRLTHDRNKIWYYTYVREQY